MINPLTPTVAMWIQLQSILFKSSFVIFDIWALWCCDVKGILTVLSTVKDSTCTTVIDSWCFHHQSPGLLQLCSIWYHWWLQSMKNATRLGMTLQRSSKAAQTISKLHYAQNLANWFSGKSLKYVSTRCQIWRLKCTKLDFHCPRPHWGAYIVPETPNWI